MIKWIDSKITSIITNILDELDLEISNESGKDISEPNFIQFNTYEKLKEKDLYIIKFHEIYKLIPFFSYIEKIYDIDVPSEYPLGSITEDRKESAFLIKSIVYNFILSSYFPEIIWKIGDCEIMIPENYLKR